MCVPVGFFVRRVVDGSWEMSERSAFCGLLAEYVCIKIFFSLTKPN